MIVFVLILLLIVFGSATAAKPNEFHRDYISRDNSNVIKGIFVILILLSHGKGYIELGGMYDQPYIAMQTHLNQMVVAMFLFYSGYGMMEQIKKRDFDYIKSIPKKRFPNLLLNFDLAVALFIILRLCMGKTLTLKSVLLSLVAWTSVGNSTWYIFITLVLYILICIAFLPIKWVKKPRFKLVCIVILTALSIGLVYLLMSIGKEKYWYNTLILLVLGFWYSYFQSAIEKVLFKNDILYALAAAAVFAVYIVFFRKRWDGIEYYTVWAICFTLLTVLFTMKIRIDSAVLKWFGEHVFSIYILQRLPMIVFSNMAFFKGHKYLFLIASFVVTLVLAMIFDTLTGKLAGLIWKPKKQMKQAAETK